MARTVKDVRLDTRAARDRLAARKKPYYRVIEAGRHIGYYKGPRGGSWVARAGEAGSYREKKLSAADDVRDANGIDVLSFGQAQAAAREWFDQIAAGEAAPTISVRTAVEDYIAARDKRQTARQGRAVLSSAANTLRLHVLTDEKLSDAELGQLTVPALQKWRKELSVAAATRQRVTNDFKAALNRAAPDATVRLTIKDGLATPRDEAPHGEDATAIENKVITDEEMRKLLKVVREAGDEDFYRLCLVLASTGARFSQASRLKVRDVQSQRSRIMMPASYKGRVGGPARPAVPVPVGQEVIDALLPVTKGRKADEPLLERWRHVQTGPAQWERDSRGPWLTASEMVRPINAAIAAADLPASVSGYSFRHSSIVRGLREGLPVRLVAQLHDTSIAMIERNYTRFMAHALEDLARKAIVPMVAEDRSDNVVSINGRGGAG